MKDKDLIENIASGQRSTWASITRTYQHLVYSTCIRILGDRQEAQDAAQDVFITLFKKAGSFRGDAKISTWLYRIAVNTSLNYLRKRKWRSFIDIFSINSNAEHAMQIPQSERPDAQLEAKIERSNLNAALAHLPPRQKAAFVLHKFNGLAYKEIAEAMNISLASVESLIHRARLTMRKKLSYLLSASNKSASNATDTASYSMKGQTNELC